MFGTSGGWHATQETRVGKSVEGKFCVLLSNFCKALRSGGGKLGFGDPVLHACYRAVFYVVAGVAGGGLISVGTGR
jgi:hypothetical protein